MGSFKGNTGRRSVTGCGKSVCCAKEYSKWYLSKLDSVYSIFISVIACEKQTEENTLLTKTLRKYNYILKHKIDRNNDSSRQQLPINP